jgi:hypothetical protein
MMVEAIEQAEERLSRAKAALKILQSSSNRADRESAWIDLITVLGTVYSKLEQGAKGSGKSSAWFGRKKHERKTDELLAYIHHARNSSEHGIARSGRYAKQSVSFTGMLKPGEMAGLRSTPSGMEPFSTDPDLELRFVENDVHLLAVRDSGVMYHPPKKHMGVPLAEFGASRMAALAVSYFENVIEEAKRLIER